MLACCRAARKKAASQALMEEQRREGWERGGVDGFAASAGLTADQKAEREARHREMDKVSECE
jgi:hypothetical protein